MREMGYKGVRWFTPLIEDKRACDREIKVGGSSLAARRKARGVYFAPVDLGHDLSAFIQEQGIVAQL
jgi:hypothetical protein